MKDNMWVEHFGCAKRNLRNYSSKTLRDMRKDIMTRIASAFPASEDNYVYVSDNSVMSDDEDNDVDNEDVIFENEPQDDGKRKTNQFSAAEHDEFFYKRLRKEQNEAKWAKEEDVEKALNNCIFHAMSVTRDKTVMEMQQNSESRLWEILQEPMSYVNEEAYNAAKSYMDNVGCCMAKSLVYMRDVDFDFLHTKLKSICQRALDDLKNFTSK